MEYITGTNVLIYNSKDICCYIPGCQHKSYEYKSIILGYCFDHYRVIKNNIDGKFFIKNILNKCKANNCDLGCQLYNFVLSIPGNRIYSVKIRDHFCFRHCKSMLNETHYSNIINTSIYKKMIEDSKKIEEKNGNIEQNNRREENYRNKRRRDRNMNGNNRNKRGRYREENKKKEINNINSRLVNIEEKLKALNDIKNFFNNIEI